MSNLYQIKKAAKCSTVQVSDTTGDAISAKAGELKLHKKIPGNHCNTLFNSGNIISIVEDVLNYFHSFC